MSSIYITWFTSTEAAIEALVNGYIQYDYTGIATPEQYDQLASYAASGKVGLNSTPTDYINYIGFAYDRYPFNNTHFRRGIQHLVNYQDITSAFDNGILGTASPYYLYPEVYPGYFSSQQQQAYETYGSFNTTAAIKEFEAAGLIDHVSQGYWSYPNGTRVSLQLDLWNSLLELGQALVSSLIANAASINITITPVVIGFDTFAYDLLPSQAMGMYLIDESGAGAPAEPNFWYSWLGDAPFNKELFHYTNATAWDLLNRLQYDSSTLQLAREYANQVGVFFQENVPIVMLGWTNIITPSNTLTWRGNVLQGGVGYAFPGDIHPANSTFGGLYRFGDNNPVSAPNIYTAVDGADIEAYAFEQVTPMQLSYNTSQLFPWVVYNWTITPGSGTMPNGHYYNGSAVELHVLQNAVWHDGTPLTAIDLNFTIWYLDLGGFAADPYNPAQDTISIAPGITLNLTATSENPSPTFFDAVPGLVGTYVSPANPYTLTVYFNTSSIFSVYSSYPGIWGTAILPEHAFYNITPNEYASEPPQDYLSQQIGAGGYMFNSWSPTGTFYTMSYFPSYFLANPYSNLYSVSQGSAASFMMNVTVYGDHVTQTPSGYFASFDEVSTGSGALYVLNPSTLSREDVVPLVSSGNGVYTATIGTSNLSPGIYYLVGQVNWTGTPYYYYYGTGSTHQNAYSYHVYAVLNITATHSKSTSSPTTASSSSLTMSSGTSGGVTTTRAAGVSTAEVVVIFLVAVAVVLIGVVASRRSWRR